MEDGSTIPNHALSFAPAKTKSYAYCSDTAYHLDIVPLIREADVLYHESTFLDSEAELSLKTKHATAKEAATIAREARVGHLILGHYSTRYGSLQLFKEEAQTIFPHVTLADDGQVFEF